MQLLLRKSVKASTQLLQVFGENLTFGQQTLGSNQSAKRFWLKLLNAGETEDEITKYKSRKSGTEGWRVQK